jgi:hypothetical protein
VTAISFVLCLAFTGRTFGHERDRFENLCPSLRNATPPDLLQFLNGVTTPDEKNAPCVTWAIHKLGTAHYEPAITALVRLLDFQRPQTQLEIIFQGPPKELYPAQVALELIGKKALPEVLSAIEADSTSATARENAVSVWMEAYKYERSEGVALLKQQETIANDGALKQKLKWAVERALTYCGSPQEKDAAACRQAAGAVAP